VSRHESVQTSTWWLVTGELGEFLKKGKQMNAKACAPGDGGQRSRREFSYDWKKHRANVRKLQARIVKAQQLGKYNKVKVL
jgi:hypothetical protein